MGVGDVVLRNDLQYERYNLVSPRELSARLRRGAGLGEPTGFGDADRVAADPTVGESTLAAPASEAPLGTGRRVSGRRPSLRSCAPSRQHQALMVAGDGEGLIDVADVGLLDGAGVVQYSASYEEPDELPRCDRRTTRRSS